MKRKPKSRAANPEPGSDDMEGRSSIDMLLSKNRDMLCRASMMADQKASIILGSEFIILTLIVTGIWSPQDAPKESFYPPLWSVAIFVSVLVSIVFSLVVLVPSLGQKSTTNKGKGGLLFFASIAEYEHQDYLEKMRKLIASDELIYDAIISDLYFEARVLQHKKYRCLKLSYLTLITGIVCALLFFGLEQFDLLSVEKILSIF